MSAQLNLDLEPGMSTSPTPLHLAPVPVPAPAPAVGTPLDTAVAAYRYGTLSAQALRLLEVVYFAPELLPDHDHSRGISYTTLGMFMEQRPSTASTDAQARGAGKKKVVARAAKELADYGILRRKRSVNQQAQKHSLGTPYLWQLGADEEAPSPRWSEAPEAIREHIRRHQRDLSLTEGAIFSVLAYLAAEDGYLELPASEFTEVGLGFTSKRTKQALSTLEERSAGIHGRTLQYEPGVLTPTHCITLAVPGSAAPTSSAAVLDDVPSRAEGQPTSTKARKPRVTLQEAEKLLAQVRHEELVKEAIEALWGTVEEGKKLSPTRTVKEVLQPVLDLQEQYPYPTVKYALEETLKGVKKGNVKPGKGFIANYAATVAENHKGKHNRNIDPTAPAPGTNAAAEYERSPEGMSKLAKQRLEEAADLNERGRHEEARAILDRMLGAIDQLAPLFDGDEAEAERHIRQAFKRGIEDFRHAFAYTIFHTDFLPEWSDQ